MNEHATPLPSKLAFLTTIRLPLWVSLALLVMLLGVFAWQQLAVKRAEARLAQERTTMLTQFENDRAALVDSVRQRAQIASDDAERRFAQALAWAVRGEMIRNNLDQVDQFFAEIVRMPGYKLALLALPDGKLGVATDRRHLGADAASLAPAGLVEASDITIRVDAEGMRWVAIPVMGLNARLGTVLLRVEQGDPLAGL